MVSSYFVSFTGYYPLKKYAYFLPKVVTPLHQKWCNKSPIIFVVWKHSITIFWRKIVVKYHWNFRVLKKQEVLVMFTLFTPVLVQRSYYHFWLLVTLLLCVYFSGDSTVFKLETILLWRGKFYFWHIHVVDFAAI